MWLNVMALRSLPFSYIGAFGNLLNFCGSWPLCIHREAGKEGQWDQYVLRVILFTGLLLIVYFVRNARGDLVNNRL
jgi:hypothetical protein